MNNVYQAVNNDKLLQSLYNMKEKLLLNSTLTVITENKLRYNLVTNTFTELDALIINRIEQIKKFYENETLQSSTYRNNRYDDLCVWS